MTMVKKIISCVFKISDGIFRKNAVSSQVRLYVDGIQTAFEYKTGGYFVLTGLPEGKHTVVINSYGFQPERTEVTVDYSVIRRPEDMVKYIMLNPSEKHPMAASRPCISGIAAGFDRIYIQRHSGELKIAEDNAVAGKSAIRLFCLNGTPVLPSVCRIGGKGSEFVTLKGVDGDMYILEKPLKYTHMRSADVVPLISVSCSADAGSEGEFFFLLSEEFRVNAETDSIPLTILAEKKDILYCAEASASKQGLSTLGKIKFRKG